MGIARFRPAHECLQQPVQIGGGLQVLARVTRRHLLQRVVVGDAQVIARGRVLAGQNDIAEPLGMAREPSLASS